MLLAGFLISCGESNDPVSAEETTDTSFSVRIQVQPPISLRTEETLNLWTTPVDVVFEPSPDGENGSEAQMSATAGGVPVGTLRKVTNGDSVSDDAVFAGSVHAAGMDINMMVGSGRDLWGMHTGGGMGQHHAKDGSHHYQIKILDAATGHHPHGGMTLSHSEVTLTAISQTDTVEISLDHVQGAHGFRYESNAALTPDTTYDLHLEIEPPDFYRTEETSTQWLSHVEAEFPGFSFDSAATSTTIGETTLVDTSEDSLRVTLEGGPVKTYGAVGMGVIEPAEDHTINFSVRLEDPTIGAEAQYLYDASVTMTVRNEEAGETETRTLKPIYGHHGFYYGENMMMEIMPGHRDGDTHGPGGGDNGHDDGH